MIIRDKEINMDYYFIAYIIWRLLWGGINGAGKELKSLFITLLVVCAVMGIFIISELTGLIKTTLQTILTSSGFWISVSSLVIALFAFFFVRSKVSEFAEVNLTTNRSRYTGAMIGVFRSIIVIYLIVMLLNFLPFGLFSESLNQSSIAKPLLTVLQMHDKEKKQAFYPGKSIEYID